MNGVRFSGNGDGNTKEDIVIAANCKSLQLRAERADVGNGRVYTTTLRVTDAVGRVGTAVRKVFVPLTVGGTAGDNGAAAGYTVNGSCP